MYGDAKDVFTFVTFLDYGYQTTKRYANTTDTEITVYCGTDINQYDKDGRMISMVSTHRVKLNGYSDWSKELNTGVDVE